MRFSSLVHFAVLSALPVAGSVRAAEEADAKAIIAKAYVAIGAEKADKPTVATWKEAGTYYGTGDDGLPYTSSCAMQLPGKFRMEVTGVFTMVVDGDKGWSNAAGTTSEMSKEQLDAQKEMIYGVLVCGIAPLVKEKGYQLKALGEEKVHDKPAIGVQVSHEGHRDVKLFIDKESHLVVKSQQRVRSEELGGKEVDEEDFYSDYRDVDGRKQPFKILMMRDGKKFVEATVSEYKPAEKLDGKLFEKP